MKFRVREVCRSKGVTMDMVAKGLGIAPSTLTRNINGNPTIGTLERIASALSVPIMDLFEQPASSEFRCPKCGTTFVVKENQKEF